ncbi:hypothetical protein V5O48_000587 [Marasmius crinis-equi]|uniref:Uncharacterized protein n=1 Tax=Marasmius crinis-equi TaxID=585013 RepID=A0ABR3G0S6_9AGAR
MTASQDPVHPSAVGNNTQVSVNDDAQRESSSNMAGEGSPAMDESYPEQRHAGAVGYGPNYHQGPTFTEKMTGVKEEVKGKVFRNQELAKQGHDRRTGELKRREREDDLNADPFAAPDESKEAQKQDKEQEKQDKEQAATV